MLWVSCFVFRINFGNGNLINTADDMYMVVQALSLTQPSLSALSTALLGQPSRAARERRRSDFKLITTISWDPSASRRPLLYTSRPPFLGMQDLITCHDLFANRVSFPSSCSVCCLYYYHFLDRKDEKGLCFSINFTPFKRGCLG